MTRRRGPSKHQRPAARTQPITADFLADALAYLRGRPVGGGDTLLPATHITLTVVRAEPLPLRTRLDVVAGLQGVCVEQTHAGSYLVDVRAEDIEAWLSRQAVAL